VKSLVIEPVDRASQIYKEEKRRGGNENRSRVSSNKKSRNILKNK